MSIHKISAGAEAWPFIYANSIFFRALNYVPPDLLGSSIKILAHPDDHQALDDVAVALTDPAFGGTAALGEAARGHPSFYVVDWRIRMQRSSESEVPLPAPRVGPRAAGLCCQMSILDVGTSCPVNNQLAVFYVFLPNSPVCLLSTAACVFACFKLGDHKRTRTRLLHNDSWFNDSSKC